MSQVEAWSTGGLGEHLGLENVRALQTYVTRHPALWPSSKTGYGVHICVEHCELIL